MNEGFVLLCFVCALGITWTRSAGSALALVYLPALLLFSMVEPLALPGLPDPTPPVAAVYGILIGSVLGNRWTRLRVTPVDVVIASLLLTYAISAITTSDVPSMISTLGSFGLEFVAPYFIVRFTCERPDVQRQALLVLVAAVFTMLFFAVIELRLWPDTYNNLLVAVGLDDPGPRFTMHRFGFFRARGPFFHPIDMGNSAVLIAASIAMIAWRASRGVSRLWLVYTLGATFLLLLFSLSFTCFVGGFAAAALYLMLLKVRPARRLLVPIVLALIVAGFAMTLRIASQPLGERPPESAEDLVKSYWIRQLIVHRSIDAATTAGPFGWGYELWKVYKLDSADNAYLLIAMQRGWIGLGLWLALPVCVARQAARGLRRSRDPAHHRAILAGFSSVVGVMVAMYTVFFGFVYSNLLMVAMGLTVNAAQARGTVRRRVRRRVAAPMGPPLPADPQPIR